EPQKGSEPATELQESEPDVEIKELDDREQPKKSEKERKEEIKDMPESEVDLTNVFDVNK
nr:hypothetical protein [Nanoarchaeota archaeon]